MAQGPAEEGLQAQVIVTNTGAWEEGAWRAGGQVFAGAGVCLQGQGAARGRSRVFWCPLLCTRCCGSHPGALPWEPNLLTPR